MPTTNQNKTQNINRTTTITDIIVEAGSNLKSKIKKKKTQQLK